MMYVVPLIAGQPLGTEVLDGKALLETSELFDAETRAVGPIEMVEFNGAGGITMVGTIVGSESPLLPGSMLVVFTDGGSEIEVALSKPVDPGNPDPPPPVSGGNPGTLKEGSPLLPGSILVVFTDGSGEAEVALNRPVDPGKPDLPPPVSGGNPGTLKEGTRGTTVTVTVAWPELTVLMIVESL